MRQSKADRLRSASHVRSKSQEPEIAKRLGGRTVKGSGSGDEKGDVRVDKIVRIEAKTTKNKSFSVTRDMVAKIENAALGAGELPAIIIEFNDDGKKVAELAVVPLWALETIAKKAWHDE
jgi:Holliday junction resolvase